MSVVTGSTVRCRLSVEAETFDGALVTVTLGNARDVDLVARREGVRFYDVTYVKFGGVVKFELFKNSLVSNLCFVKMTFSRFNDQLFSEVFKTELYGIVSVGVGRLLLHNNAGTALNNGYGNDISGFREKLRHADLSANDSFFHFRITPFGYWLAFANLTAFDVFIDGNSF